MREEQGAAEKGEGSGGQTKGSLWAGLSTYFVGPGAKGKYEAPCSKTMHFKMATVEPAKHGTLCTCTGCTPMKLVLPMDFSVRAIGSHRRFLS